MKQIFVFLCIVGLVFACGNSEESEQNNTSAKAVNTSASTPDGQKIYKQYCVTCHGLYGNMGASGAFNLTTSELPVADRIVVITKGRGAMTPFESLLDEDEIKAVAEYTLELKR